MQLRQKLKAQTDEVTQLQSKLTKVHSEHQKEVCPYPFTCSVYQDPIQDEADSCFAERHARH